MAEAYELDPSVDRCSAGAIFLLDKTLAELEKVCPHDQPIDLTPFIGSEVVSEYGRGRIDEAFADCVIVLLENGNGIRAYCAFSSVTCAVYPKGRRPGKPHPHKLQWRKNEHPRAREKRNLDG